MQQQPSQQPVAPTYKTYTESQMNSSGGRKVSKDFVSQVSGITYRFFRYEFKDSANNNYYFIPVFNEYSNDLTPQGEQIYVQITKGANEPNSEWQRMQALFRTAGANLFLFPNDYIGQVPATINVNGFIPIANEQFGFIATDWCINGLVSIEQQALISGNNPSKFSIILGDKYTTNGKLEQRPNRIEQNNLYPQEQIMEFERSQGRNPVIGSKIIKPKVTTEVYLHGRPQCVNFIDMFIVTTDPNTSTIPIKISTQQTVASVQQQTAQSGLGFSAKPAYLSQQQPTQQQIQYQQQQQAYQQQQYQQQIQYQQQQQQQTVVVPQATYQQQQPQGQQGFASQPVYNQLSQTDAYTSGARQPLPQTAVDRLTKLLRTADSGKDTKATKIAKQILGSQGDSNLVNIVTGRSNRDNMSKCTLAYKKNVGGINYRLCIPDSEFRSIVQTSADDTTSTEVLVNKYQSDFFDNAISLISTEINISTLKEEPVLNEVPVNVLTGIQAGPVPAKRQVTQASTSFVTAIPLAGVTEISLPLIEGEKCTPSLLAKKRN